MVRPAQGTLAPTATDDLRRSMRKSIFISASRQRYSIIFEPAGRAGRRASTRYFVNGSIDGVRIRGNLRNASEKLINCPQALGLADVSAAEGCMRLLRRDPPRRAVLD